MVTDRLVSTYTVIYTTQIEGSIVVPPPPQVIEIIIILIICILLQTVNYCRIVIVISTFCIVLHPNLWSKSKQNPCYILFMVK